MTKPRRIKCAHCKSPDGHETVAQVKLCSKRIHTEMMEAARQAQENAAEVRAELAAERYFEEGPNGPVDDPIEREKWALEDMRADAIIAEKKAATLALLERWRAANPGRQLNGYACTPYSRCNCPTSYSRCSSFAVLERFEEKEHDQAIAAREIAQDQAAAVAKMDRGFSLGGTRRNRPW